MTRARLEAAMETLPSDWSGEFSLDADGLTDLYHKSGLELSVCYMPDPSNSVVVLADLGEPKDQLAVYRRVLEGAYLWSETMVVSIGIRPGSDTLAAFASLPVDDGLVERFPSHLQRFVDACLQWSDRLTDFDSELPTEAIPMAGPHSLA